MKRTVSRSLVKVTYYWLLATTTITVHNSDISSC